MAVSRLLFGAANVLALAILYGLLSREMSDHAALSLANTALLLLVLSLGLEPRA